MTAARQSGQQLIQELEPLRGPLTRFFMRRVANAAEAEDLTQDTFTRLIAAAGGHAPIDPKAFVFRTALNLLRDRARRLQTRASAQIDTIAITPVSPVTLEFVEDRDPERVLQAQDELSHVMSVLDELKPRTRDIFLLFRLENMKQAAIADLYGISRSTVEKEVMRATLHLATRLGAMS